jgi:class 3 adenylate cyclase
MNGRPETRYARVGQHISVAYQVVGDGPVDLIYLQGYASHVDVNWEWEPLARFLNDLARVGRLIVMDPRGSGASERFAPPIVPPLESLMDDLNAVMEATQSARAVIFATEEYGFIAIPFAATYPDRCIGLVLWAASPTWLRDEEITWAWDEEEWRKQTERLLEGWGREERSQEEFPRANPSLAGDPNAAEIHARRERASTTPTSSAAMVQRWYRTDVRGVLPAVHVPTLVLHASGDQMESPENARYLASHIAGAKLELVEGRDHLPFLSQRPAVVEAVRRFVAQVQAEQATLERVLATVLFTDIVGSTERMAELGDTGWRALVTRHHATVRAHLARFRGQEIDTAGDGFFVSFDGPARAITCARAIVDDAASMGLELRAGLHTGECETIDGKVGGLAVVIGARVGSLAGPSQVLVSQTVKDLVAGSGLTFEDAGDHELKGVPERWHLYRVID